MVSAALDETGLRLPPALLDELTAGDEEAVGAGTATGAATAAAAGAGHAVGGANGHDALAIRAFGRFEMLVGDRQVDLAGLKPRPRALLRLLALNAGRPVHREVLIDSLWPEADPDTAARSLHVALSAIRHELQPGGQPGQRRAARARRGRLPDRPAARLARGPARVRGGRRGGSRRADAGRRRRQPSRHSGLRSPSTRESSCPRTGRPTGSSRTGSDRVPTPWRRRAAWPSCSRPGPRRRRPCALPAWASTRTTTRCGAS